MRLFPVILVGLLTVACTAPAPEGRQTLRGDTMGTTYAVTVDGVPPASQDTGLLASAISELLTSLDTEKMSTYDTESEVSRFNRWRSTEWFTVSHDTFEVFRHAREVSAVTDGAFDVTIGALVDAWGFGPSGTPAELPSETDIDRLLTAVGYSLIELHGSTPAIRKLNPDLTSDLSAVAKGYAVDRVADLLDAHGYESYLIEIGGEVRTRGRRASGRPWRIGIERPADGSPTLQRVVELSDASLATSGDYRNYVEQQGVRLSHTVDPRTGRPIMHRLASVSVIEPLCVRADAIATALGVLGPEDGFRLALEHGWAALMIVREDDGRYREVATPAFLALVGASGPQGQLE